MLIHHDSKEIADRLRPYFKKVKFAGHSGNLEGSEQKVGEETLTEGFYEYMEKHYDITLENPYKSIIKLINNFETIDWNKKPIIF